MLETTYYEIDSLPDAKILFHYIDWHLGIAQAFGTYTPKAWEQEILDKRTELALPLGSKLTYKGKVGFTYSEMKEIVKEYYNTDVYALAQKYFKYY